MSRIYKKAICLMLSLMLLFSCSFFAAAGNTEVVLAAAIKLIVSNEGDYTSVVADDNGAVSIGKVGWHATRALELLKVIVNDDKSQAIEILGTVFTDEILTETNWNNRIFTSGEKSAVEKLLATSQSRDVQDDFASKDIMEYITHGMSIGLHDGKTLIYFADLENQMGGDGAARVAQAAITTTGSAANVTLDAIYRAALDDKTAGSSPTRRKNTYDYCRSLDFGDVSISNVYKSGNYKITASSLRVRSGPGTSYGSVASAIPNGTVVNVTNISGDWGKVTYNNVTGWICLLYTDYIDATQADALMGDVNGNGKIDAADARLVLRYSAKLESLSAAQIKLADMNGDGHITASDARSILQKAANLIV